MAIGGIAGGFRNDKPSNEAYTGNDFGGSGVINISKGAKINLSKETPGLKKIMVGLGWDVNTDYGEDFDLDASVFMLDSNGKSKPEWFIYYNNLQDPNKCVVHQGDNRTGSGEGDDERIYIDLDLIPPDVDKIAITITIDQADKKRQNFGMVKNSFCRLVDSTNDSEIIHYDLGEDFSIETAIVVGEVYRHKGDWKFNAIGRGFSGGLIALCRNYGLDAEYK